jgi:hypothetical protein
LRARARGTRRPEGPIEGRKEDKMYIGIGTLLVIILLIILLA